MSAEMAQIIAQCGGTASRAELRDVMSQTALTRAVREGTLLRPRRGLYTLPGLDASIEGAHRASGVVSHRSAALLHGWGVLHAPKTPEVTVPRHLRLSSPRRTGLHLRWRTLDPEDTSDGVTTPLRTVIDCARDLPLPESLSVADSALRSGAVTRAGLDGVALPRTGRVRAARVLELASDRADNPFESGLRALALEATDEPWVPQAPVTLRNGRVLHADAGLAEARVALEADSHQFHKSRSDIVRDCNRYDEMILAGWIVLRFAWEHVMFHADWVREVIAWVVGQRLGVPRGRSLSA